MSKQTKQPRRERPQPPEDAEWLQNIEEAPTFYPTKAEFADPMAYIKSIQAKGSQYGICKIVPPVKTAVAATTVINWEKTFRFSARYQVVKQQSWDTFDSARFMESDKTYTLKEFEDAANREHRKRYKTYCDQSAGVVEADYWREFHSSKKAESVWYGNDREGTGFADPNSRDPLAQTQWNLQVLPKAADSTLRLLEADIPGVTSPMLYIGWLFATFAWHVEDQYLYSINYQHMGAAKTWYGVPASAADGFESVVVDEVYRKAVDRAMREGESLGKATSRAHKALLDKTTMFSPKLLLDSGVKVCRVVQNAGEFVVTFPRAYHAGFSNGYNIGEAVNFGMADWYSFGRDACLRYSRLGTPPMLAHDQLLCIEAELEKKRVESGADASTSRTLQQAFVRLMAEQKEQIQLLQQRGATVRFCFLSHVLRTDAPSIHCLNCALNASAEESSGSVVLLNSGFAHYDDMSVAFQARLAANGTNEACTLCMEGLTESAVFAVTEGLTEDAYLAVAEDLQQERRESHKAAGASRTSGDAPAPDGKKSASSARGREQLARTSPGSGKRRKLENLQVAEYAGGSSQAGRRGSFSGSDHSRQGSEDTVVDAEGRSLGTAEVNPFSLKQQQTSGGASGGSTELHELWNPQAGVRQAVAPGRLPLKVADVDASMLKDVATLLEDLGCGTHEHAPAAGSGFAQLTVPPEASPDDIRQGDSPKVQRESVQPLPKNASILRKSSSRAASPARRVTMRIKFGGKTTSREVSLEPGVRTPSEVVAETPRHPARSPFGDSPPSSADQCEALPMGAELGTQPQGKEARKPDKIAGQTCQQGLAEFSAPGLEAEAAGQLPADSGEVAADLGGTYRRPEALPGSGAREGLQEGSEAEPGRRPSADNAKQCTITAHPSGPSRARAGTGSLPIGSAARASAGSEKGAEMGTARVGLRPASATGGLPSGAQIAASPTLADVFYCAGSSERLLQASAAVAAADKPAIDAALCKGLRVAVGLEQSQAGEEYVAATKKAKVGKPAARGADMAPAAKAVEEQKNAMESEALRWLNEIEDFSVLEGTELAGFRQTRRTDVATVVQRYKEANKRPACAAAAENGSQKKRKLVQVH